MSARTQPVVVMQWRREVRESKSLRAIEKEAGQLLANYMNGAGEECFPSVERLAEESSRHVRTIQRAIGGLVAKGYLHRQVGNGRGHVSSYVAAFPKGRHMAALSPAVKGGERYTETAAYGHPEEPLVKSQEARARARAREGDDNFENRKKNNGPGRRKASAPGRRKASANGKGSVRGAGREPLADSVESARQLARQLIDERGWPTGSRWLATQGGTYIQDPLGYDKPPPTYAVPWSKPTLAEIVAALRSRGGRP